MIIKKSGEFNEGSRGQTDPKRIRHPTNHWVVRRPSISTRSPLCQVYVLQQYLHALHVGRVRFCRRYFKIYQLFYTGKAVFCQESWEGVGGQLFFIFPSTSLCVCVCVCGCLPQRLFLSFFYLPLYILNAMPSCGRLLFRQRFYKADSISFSIPNFIRTGEKEREKKCHMNPHTYKQALIPTGICTLFLLCQVGKNFSIYRKSRACQHFF